MFFLDGHYGRRGKFAARPQSKDKASLLRPFSNQKKFLSVLHFVIVLFMREFSWSPTQKKAARAAFDLAIARELKSIRDHVETMLQNLPDDRSVWSLEDYLSEKRREFDQKYDYRYSVLMWVFPRLIAEGWLKVEELSGIGEEKVEVFKELMSPR